MCGLFTSFLAGGHASRTPISRPMRSHTPHRQDQSKATAPCLTEHDTLAVSPSPRRGHGMDLDGRRRGAPGHGHVGQHAHARWGWTDAARRATRSSMAGGVNGGCPPYGMATHHTQRRRACAAAWIVGGTRLTRVSTTACADAGCAAYVLDALHSPLSPKGAAGMGRRPPTGVPRPVGGRR